jgi:hypothetical protein
MVELVYVDIYIYVDEGEFEEHVVFRLGWDGLVMVVLVDSGGWLIIERVVILVWIGFSLVEKDAMVDDENVVWM